MEIRFMADNSQMFSTPEKYEKDSPINMTLHSA